MSSELATLEAAAALLALVRAVQESEVEPTAEELAALLPPVVDMLADVIGVAARRLQPGSPTAP